ncbi:MAG: hypothetical protein GXO34_05980, partial [Deltaproteobacteria bacterium]|nr:hypothetical protein [Deltaproteobacteria bacterium]
MKKIVSLGLSTLLLAMMFSFSTPAKAETRYVYKWLQPYDLENGIDIKSTIYNDLSGNYEWHAVADDWQCRDERPVTDIHWWGSYWEKDANGGWVPFTGEEDPYWKMNTSPQFHL